MHPKDFRECSTGLMKYNLDVVHTPGKDMLLADTLGRAYLPEGLSYGSVEAEIETVNMVHLSLETDSMQSAVQQKTIKHCTFSSKQ